MRTEPNTIFAVSENLGNLQEAIIKILRETYDPEIPVNIYDLGMIYHVNVSPDGKAHLRMTLTSPNCPAVESLPAEVELKVGQLAGITESKVELVWEPPWDKEMMTDTAKFELNLI